jgi:hypothetical protein
MFLLDESLRLMDHKEVDNLVKSQAGRKAFEELFTKNRVYEASLAIRSFLVENKIVRGLTENQTNILFDIILDCIMADEETQNDFALLYAKEEGMEN